MLLHKTKNILLWHFLQNVKYKCDLNHLSAPKDAYFLFFTSYRIENKTSLKSLLRRVIFSFCTHNCGCCGSCWTCLPGLAHGSTCWSHLPWFGLALSHSHSHSHAHALSLGLGLLLGAVGCCGTGLPWSGCWSLGLLLELSPLSRSPICLGTRATLPSWSRRPTSRSLSPSRATARPWGAWVEKKGVFYKQFVAIAWKWTLLANKKKQDNNLALIFLQLLPEGL